MDINMIVAAGKDGAIGKNGDLIWHLPGDLKRFKTLTMGHPVIMGRKTWDSLPKKPLPGRLNIILSRKENIKQEGVETASSVEEAIALCQGESPFIIGGEQIYRLFFPFVTKLYLTKVDCEYPEADAFIDIDLDPAKWKITAESEPADSSQSGVPFRYIDFERI